MERHRSDIRAPLSAGNVLRRVSPPLVEYVELDGEIVVYHCPRRRMHLLDRTGSLVWKLLDGSTSLGVTSEELAEAFGRSSGEVLADLRVFVGDLEEIGIVERVR